ncbi:DNA helicase/exodeoxyribonuclease V beta subunit [Pseudomonas duriflava]|uniref:RecBCD enzyme subunit RecB n=1 Tax=Pseudomonas duriflava TaxID=459528 RepID=A0A562QR12_9PSED|nr:exodeoxyribonuclease V subunit beta [Pseudomonas duriflava]TWI58640.1 DNA helicase/exodeoxyribonuclease V beta subunit [Pseudomonas duriflava]
MSPLHEKPLALRFPLRGSQLIEASAGTGKTFTISALYVRLILGHGGEAGFGQELLPPQILVVTFTDAATRELRDRIRARLFEAACYFRNEIEAPDPLIAMLRQDFPETQWPGCARKLDMAAQWMDEAAVSTIHSWCQRMLREHAFDSGSLFSQTLETDHSELVAEVVRDYWRRFCYALSGEALAWVREHWVSPEHLARAVQDLIQAETQGVEDVEPGSLIDECLRRKRELLKQLKAPWAAWAEELRMLCDDACARKAVDGRKFRAQWYNPWCDKLIAWAQDEAAEVLDLGSGFDRLTSNGLAEIWKTGSPPEHPALQAMGELKTTLDSLPRPDVELLQHAAHWIKQRFILEKRRRAEMGFDDLLARLDVALQSDGAGERLAEVIREQFPVALIDEFQDTDPVQYRIFETIYRIRDNDPKTGLFLIGDPKQAIYAFRGADIYTYLKARFATEGRLHTLDTNYRSSEAMVAAVNQVFQQAEVHEEGRGAFMFRRDGSNPLPFHAVRAQGRKERLVVDGQGVAALTVWHLAGSEPVSGTTYRQQLAETGASEIVRLLNLGQQGKAGFEHPEKGFQALQPADIAVLVRDGNEAQAIRAQLAARGVRSVYLSDKDSVFNAQEAHCLLAWLRACAEPDVDRILRAGLASITLNLPLAELDRLNHDEHAWETRVMQFRGYRSLWRTQGVLPMLRRLLHDFQLPQTLMARVDGERVLTNLLHLAELLQQAAAELDGEQALIRYLAEHLTEGRAAEEQILRLESDEALVKVVTIHKSKGLEYPLVFLPFICSFRPVDGSRIPVRYHDDEGNAKMTLTPDVSVIERADEERLAEDLRLLYVALTRAQHACWMGVADLKRGNNKASTFHRCALGYLTTGGNCLPSSGVLEGMLKTVAGGSPTIVIQPRPEATNDVFQPRREQQPERKALEPARTVAEHWWIASYSALRIGEPTEDIGEALRHTDLSPENPEAQKLFDDDRLPEAAEFPAAASGADLHRFPRGPGPGTFLHGLLEWAGQEGFASVAEQPVLIEDAIARRCNRRGWEGWIVTLTDWLKGLLTTRLPLGDSGDVLCLAELGQYQIEMEFWFSARQMQASRLDTLVSRHVLSGLPRPPVEPSLLNGMFKGFIDLVFEYQGRYYVADYKSNWLGADDAAYTPAAMAASVLESRYDLQYVLYLLALHRQLKARLPDYDYDRHMGGACYLFLRGARAASQGVFFDRPPRILIETLDHHFQGNPQPMEANA